MSQIPTLSASAQPYDPDNDLSDRDFVKKGFNFWINNQPKESELFFKRRSDRTTVLAGYTFILCMNGVISYEVDKIIAAQNALKQLEKRCTMNTCTTPSTPSTSSSAVVNDYQPNWLSSVRYRIFGNVTGLSMPTSSIEYPKSTAQLLEEQIILGDTYMSMAILTFLTQDFAGLMKGGWLLRKAWKIYQKTYKQLYEIYIKRFGSNSLDNPPRPFNYLGPANCANYTSFSYFNYFTSRSYECSDRNHQNPSEIIESNRNNRIITQNDHVQESSDQNPSRKMLNLELKPHQYGFDNVKSCPTYSISNNNSIPSWNSNIDSDSLKHLLAASSFGYGLFQLTTSLLPAKLLKIISIFGFESDRDLGLSCLTYARLSSDIRAVLATLSLLWFYTFGTQLFSNEDGYSNEKIEAVNSILNECNEQYENSAIFLFFRGRLERMKADTAAATECFRKSFRLSAQNELKLLCLHEIAWCALIQLDFVNAMNYFNEIRQVSVYSKAFYTYMTAICQGSSGKYENLRFFSGEIKDLVRKPVQKQSYIVTFVQNRLSKFDDKIQEDQLYWRFLVYEMLFLWNTFPNIGADRLMAIIEDCTKTNSISSEPMIGLKELIVGGAHAASKKYSEAIEAYEQCITKRIDLPDQDLHITAFAQVELASILIHCYKTDAQSLQKAKILLQNAQKLQNYDLENQLCVQIQQELKKIN